jgi:hypothetical protein
MRNSSSNQHTFNKEMSEDEYNMNMLDLLPRITKEDVRNRIMHMKKNTAAGPDGLTKDDIEPTKKNRKSSGCYTYLSQPVAHSHQLGMKTEQH